jgi:hypothetical protein
MLANQRVFAQWNREYEREQLEAGARYREPLELVCECSQLRCSERLHVSARDYDRIHRRQLQFVVAPGHAALGSERVLERREGYDIVSKAPDPSRA